MGFIGLDAFTGRMYPCSVLAGHAMVPLSQSSQPYFGSFFGVSFLKVLFLGTVPSGFCAWDPNLKIN